MKLYSLTIYKLQQKLEEPIVLYSIINSKEFSIFVQSDAKKVLIEIGREVIKRVTPKMYYSINEEREYVKGVVHAYVNNNQGCVIISDNKYPVKHINVMLSQSLNVMTNSFNIASVKNDMQITNDSINKLFVDNINYLKNDKIIKIQNELDETKTIMINSVDKLLERNVKLEDLLIRSDKLSNESKIFLTNSEKLNSCCNII